MDLFKVLGVNEQFDQGSPNKSTKTYSEADTLLGPSHGETSYCDATKLYEKHLHHESEHKNSNEEPIVEEALENIDFITQLTTVDLVEDLHEDEALEQNCVDECFVCLSLSWGTIAHKASIRTIWQIKNVLSNEKDHQ